jgi:hypothetical protein
MRQLILSMVLLAAGVLLGGCPGQVPRTVENGECRVFDDPGFAVQGKRLKDRQWIGRTQEKGINVCHWRRPSE